MRRNLWAVYLIQINIFQDWEPYPHPGFGFVTFHPYPVSYLDKGVVYNSLECSPEMADISNQPVNIGHQDLKTKFKVVKVETTQPLKRGRWTCIDFTDKHSTPAPAAAAASTVSSGSDGGGGSKSVAATATTKTMTRTEVERHYSGGQPAVETAAVTLDSSLSSASSAKEPDRQVSEPEFTEERQEEVTSSNYKEPEESDQTELTVETYLDTAKAGVTSLPQPHEPVPAVTSSSKSALNSPGSAPEQSTKTKPGLHIGLQQAVPVITATPHSPITSAAPPPQMPDVNNLQQTIGQVIRLNDGTLAQVALAPLTPQQQQLGNTVIPNSGQMVQQQQQQQYSAVQQQYMVPQAQVPPTQPLQPHPSQSNPPQQSAMIQQSMKSSTNQTQQQNLVNYPPPIQQQIQSVGAPHVPMQHQNTSQMSVQMMPPPPVVSVSSSELSMMPQFPAPAVSSLSSPTKRSSVVSGASSHQSRPLQPGSGKPVLGGAMATFSYIQEAGAGILSLTGDRDGGLVEKLEMELGEQSRTEVGDLGELDR